MNRDLFYELDMDARAELVWDKGEYISSIDYYGRRVSLFILEGLYVEVFYNPQENVIEEVEVLDPSEVRLNLYTSAVSIRNALG